MRDVKEIGYKIKCVIIPSLRHEASRKLRDCIIYNIINYLFRGSLGSAPALSYAVYVIKSSHLICSVRTLAWSHTDSALVFQIVFIVVWLGAIIITLNGQLLGGSM